MVVDAGCRNIEILGEAANRLDAEYRNAHPAVPWRSLINPRNLLIHAYDQVNPAVLGGLWSAISRDWRRQSDVAPREFGGVRIAGLIKDLKLPRNTRGRDYDGLGFSAWLAGGGLHPGRPITKILTF
ncbi:MAG: DUF86 domain-containing protein [Acidobacteriia bacterium]|nr:DUF86 domain-containing protein [Terriglobia bacterium]